MSQEQLIQDLETALAARAFSQLQPLVQQAIEQFPDQAFGYYFQCESHALRNEYEAAIEALNKAIQLDATNIRYQLRLAAFNLEAGELDAAQAIYNQLLPNHPNDAALQAALGRLALEQLDAENALLHLNKAIELDSKEAHFYLLRAQLYQNTQEYEKALADLNKYLASYPEDQAAILQQVAIYELLGDFARAQDGYNQLFMLDDKNMGYRFNYARFLASTKHYAEAEEQFNRLINFDTENPTFYAQRAAVRLQLDKLDEAAEDCSISLALDAENAETYLTLADVRMAQYDPSMAIQTLTQAIESQVNGLHELHKKRGLIYVNEYDFIRAEEDFLKMTEDTFGGGEGYYHLGMVYLQRDEREKAFEAWTKADEMFYPEAAAAIKEHCADLLAKAQQAAEDGYLAAYQADFERNKQSPILQQLFGKFWKFDEANTTKKNAVLKQLPEDARGQILGAFAKMTLFFSEQGFLFLNLEQQDLRAIYKIKEETKSNVKIIGQSMIGGDERTFTLELDGKLLMVDGLANDVQFEIFFEQLDYDKLGKKEKEALQKRQNEGVLAYLGEALTL